MRSFLQISFELNYDEALERIISHAANFEKSIVLQTGIDFATTVVGAVSTNYQLIAGIDSVADFLDGFEPIVAKSKNNSDWLLGYISYDYKNDLECLTSLNNDQIRLPKVLFFCPRYLILKRDKWEIGYLPQYDNEESAKDFVDDILNCEGRGKMVIRKAEMQPRVSFDRYRENIHHIQQHIQRGDIYEMNYCMEFFNEHAEIDPTAVYNRLATVSPVPFGAFAKFNDTYLMCASPERYLQKKGRRLVSQPIKGTAPRSNDEVRDQQNRQSLMESEKERAENTMIVDLVRNDLARVAKRASVKVDELCGVYCFRQVYQMISTVSAELDDQFDWLDAIKATFPMGSMTGAPKLKAMELIEQYEDTKRGLYSGAVGYIDPNGDFDFNVVIRSLLYNRRTHYLSYMVGSAITAQSNAEDEYHECLLKGQAIRQVLSGD